MHSPAPLDPLRVCAIACTGAERGDVAEVLGRVLGWSADQRFPLTITEKYAVLRFLDQLR